MLLEDNFSSLMDNKMADFKKFPKSVIRIYKGPLKFFIPFFVVTQIFMYVTTDFDVVTEYEFYISTTLILFQFFCWIILLASFCLFFILRDFPNPNGLPLSKIFYSEEYDAFLDKPRLSIASMPITIRQLFAAYFLSAAIVIIPAIVF